ncbi:MAG: FAD-dependent oxidoreductase [Bacteroidales bacterium]|nr:FAD-dependent oxidoreductase [Bacteroidales bacterium]
MNRRNFSKNSLLLGLGALAARPLFGASQSSYNIEGETYNEPSKKIPTKKFDVVIAGGGTAGVVAAIASARTGAKTALIELKGYPGGTVVEGGTALHSYFNVWKPFPGVKKRQVVKGIAQEIIDRLEEIGGTNGHSEMEKGGDYDSICTAIDTELYKLICFRMMKEAGVYFSVNTRVVGAIRKGDRLEGAIIESRSGREAFLGKSFIDATAYGDLSNFAKAECIVQNDYSVCNSFGMGNINIERYYDFISNNKGFDQIARGTRSGEEDQIIRLSGGWHSMPEEFHKEMKQLGVSSTTTTVHDNYLMFIKCNFKIPQGPLDREAVSQSEYIIRENQLKAIELFNKYVPGCEKSFLARTSPSLNIRRARTVVCDYDMTTEDVLEARHFDDDIMAYGFHDNRKLLVKDGGTYGLPYRAMLVKDIENLYAIGMHITKEHRPHMSTRNTVCCMGQGQAAGTAAALCALNNVHSRELSYDKLRKKLVSDGVHIEN